MAAGLAFTCTANELSDGRLTPLFAGPARLIEQMPRLADRRTRRTAAYQRASLSSWEDLTYPYSFIPVPQGG